MIDAQKRKMAKKNEIEIDLGGEKMPVPPVPPTELERRLQDVET